MRLEPPTDSSLPHMPSDRPTRQPGTPVGELVARPSSQLASTSRKPKPSQSPGLPHDIFCSDSDSDIAYIATPSPPTHGEKPKPSAAPHLQWAACASKPDEDSLSLPQEDLGSQLSLSLPKEDFGGQINFDFCKQQAQTLAHSANCRTQGPQPKSRACAKLLVRSGLRCSCCFSLKSACLCLKTFSQHCTISSRTLLLRCLLSLHGSGLSLSGRGASFSLS